MPASASVFSAYVSFFSVNTSMLSLEASEVKSLHYNHFNIFLDIRRRIDSGLLLLRCCLPFWLLPDFDSVRSLSADGLGAPAFSASLAIEMSSSPGRDRTTWVVFAGTYIDAFPIRFVTL